MLNTINWVSSGGEFHITKVFFTYSISTPEFLPDASNFTRSSSTRIEKKRLSLALRHRHSIEDLVISELSLKLCLQCMCWGPVQMIRNVHTQEPEVVVYLHYWPANGNRCMVIQLSLFEVKNQFFGLVVLLMMSRIVVLHNSTSCQYPFCTCHLSNDGHRQI